MLFSNLDFLFFQAGDGCVSNCQGCKRQFQAYRLGSMETLLGNIERVKTKGYFSGNILIYNIDFFHIPASYKEEILKLKNDFLGIFFHTDFRDIKSREDIPDDINFVYQRDFSQYEMVFLYSFFSQYTVSNESLFILWCEDFQLVGKFLKLLINKNVSFQVVEKTSTLIAISINGTILKFFLKDGERRNLEKCFFNKSIHLGEQEILFQKDIFHISCLEILMNGDIRAHEPPCGFGNIIISNIHKAMDLLRIDFGKFKNHIESFHIEYAGLKQKDICKKCITLDYKYE